MSQSFIVNQDNVVLLQLKSDSNTPSNVTDMLQKQQRNKHSYAALVKTFYQAPQLFLNHNHWQLTSLNWFLCEHWQEYLIQNIADLGELILSTESGAGWKQDFHNTTMPGHLCCDQNPYFSGP